VPNDTLLCTPRWKANGACMVKERSGDPRQVFQIDSALKAVMEASPAGLAVFDHDARILYANPVAERIFEKRLPEAAGIKCGEFLGCASQHAESQACGHTKDCPDCPFFRAICAACSEEGRDGAISEGETLLKRGPCLPDMWLKYRVRSLFADGRRCAVMAVDDITRQKRDEAKLRHAMAELSVIYEHAPIAMLLVDRDRRVHKVNGFAAGFADRPHDEMVGLPGGEALRCLYHMDDPKGCGFGPACAECPVRRAVLETFETGLRQTKIEARLPFPRGGTVERRCLLISTAILKIDSVERVLLCFQDITALKHTEKELIHSRDLMRYIIEHANSAVAVHDLGLRYVYVSQNYLNHYNLRERDVIGKHYYDVFPDLPRKWREAHRRALAGEVSGADRDPCQRDGEPLEWTRWECRPWYEADGSIGGIILYNEVITDQVQAEETLRKSEMRYRSLFESIRDAILVADSERNIIDCNAAFCDLFGYTLEEIEGRKTLFVYESEHEYAQLGNALKERSGDHGFLHVVNYKKKSGDHFPGETSVFYLGGEDGTVAGFIGMIRDITGRRRLEKEKARLEVQYRQMQKVESIGRLAGGVAHDLNNLLSPILGYSEMLLGDLDPEDNRRESVDEIMSAGLRARDLVRQLLAFSRKQTLEFKPVDLSDAVAGLEKLLRRTMPEDIIIEFDLCSDAIVMADLSQIEQVIMNLSVNAADAMSEGGRLTIETSRTSLDTQYADKHPGATPGEYAVLAISDTGLGMDDGTRENIFEPFFSTKGDQGTGLGLATVYGVVKQHGGNIWVYSEPGEGTTFKVYLPISENVEIEGKGHEQGIMCLKGSETVLLVEDNDQVRRLAHSIMKRSGYRVLSAKDGGEALQALERCDGPIDLLLTDVILPRMNGREVYEKARETHPHIKVLYMSGYTDNVIAHRGVLDEGVHFIQKPFTVEGLAVKIRETLDER